MSALQCDQDGLRVVVDILLPEPEQGEPLRQREGILLQVVRDVAILRVAQAGSVGVESRIGVPVRSIALHEYAPVGQAEVEHEAAERETRLNRDTGPGKQSGHCLLKAVACLARSTGYDLRDRVRGVSLASAGPRELSGVRLPHLLPCFRSVSAPSHRIARSGDPLAVRPTRDAHHLESVLDRRPLNTEQPADVVNGKSVIDVQLSNSFVRERVPPRLLPTGGGAVHRGPNERLSGCDLERASALATGSLDSPPGCRGCALSAAALPPSVCVRRDDIKRLVARSAGDGDFHSHNIPFGSQSNKVGRLADPPYVHDTRATTSDYAHEMTIEQHRALLSSLTSLRGKFMLSGYANPLYDEFAAANSWARHDFDLPNNAAGGVEKRRMVESLWCNF